ncbi:hypothetical protein AJ78_00355 [Emergomyces pasteurianus Ep9510]|uniref:Cytosine-specific methyltransferase n=1 Tax=Emergomyces pasteurianus Ep9510 TaxID=1447872 RepID=A0A1J9QV49_9EURO|nr:hypothetical protein AJ78_00355 [Emergomyces pasteurianus Ep9510]
MVSLTDSEALNADPNITDLQQENVDHEQTQQPAEAARRCGKSLEELVSISPPSLTFPKSSYHGHETPQPKSTEKEAVAALLREPRIDRQTYDENEFMSLQLDDFVIYALPYDSPAPYGMVSLDQVAGKLGKQTARFFFDGVLKVPGSHGLYLEKVPFRFVSIGGYEDIEQHSVGKDMWIQSIYGASTSIGDLWYQLGTAAPEYADYHKSFCWLADLAKHFIDYLHNHEDITLQHFKSEFSAWLKNLHGADLSFMQWIAECRCVDFRQAINAHSSFLEKQAWDLDPSYCNHRLWAELGTTKDNLVLPMQPQKAKGTIVTPYVYQCFKNMEWANHLTAVEFDPEILAKRRSRLQELGFLREGKMITKPKLECTVGLKGAVTVCPGDVIAVRRDHQTPWNGTEDLWYAVIQDAKPRKNGPARLNLIWLYRPSETVCANLTYPHENELFFSDHCNCNDAIIDTSEVVEKVKVTFFAHQAEKDAKFFIRQTYFSEDETFTSLKEEHFYCHCRKFTSKPHFSIGDTVLIEKPNESSPEQLYLEPVEIIEFGESGQVHVRELLRRGRDYNDATCRPNELVYTNRTRSVHVDQIARRCQVRFYTEEEIRDGSIPPPYNRDGAGDAFFISTQEICFEKRSELVSLQHPPVGFKEGPNHSEDSTFPRLQALNIFSGGGSFDRGLEEGGAIKNMWAVEWSTAPMLTYRANHDNPEKIKLFLGSVNDFLLQACKGKAKASNLVAELGNVEFISAGSPCQGYSSVNCRKGNAVSMKNSSMIASVASYVDFYRPKYAILENVITMSNRNHEKNPLCQLLCTFVGMGYQVRILNLDAWSFGAPQSRSRLFIVIAAPGLQLPAHPPLTHSHPVKTTQKSLGKAPNGLPFGKRHWDIPAFDFLTVSESIKDLPHIGTARTAPIYYPDHRPIRFESTRNQDLINSIPKAPRIQGLSDAIKRGFFSQEEDKKNALQRSSQRSWSRIHPYLLMPTVTTFPSPWCKFTGRWLHWDEDRLMTVMEVRRAQGFPDNEVLIGSPIQQWKIVGNSVTRQVALALGLVVRDAVLQNQCKKENESNITVTNGIQAVSRLGEEFRESAVDAAAESAEESAPEAASEAEAGQKHTLVPWELAILHTKKQHGNHSGLASESHIIDLTRDASTTPPPDQGFAIKRTKSLMASILGPWRGRPESVTVSDGERVRPNSTSNGALDFGNQLKAFGRSFDTLGPGHGPVAFKRRRLDDNRDAMNEHWSGFI